MDKTLYLMQGIPGSGKSTVAHALAVHLRHVGEVQIYSTDDFWYIDSEKYQFDISRIAKAHQWNQKRTVAAMQEEVPVIIIDNTNIKRDDVVPYKAFAQTYGYTVQVISVHVDYKVAIQRQANRPEDRRIPDTVIIRMDQLMEDIS